MAQVSIPAFTEPDLDDDMIRYSFQLVGPDGKPYDFIIDLPKDGTASSDRNDVDVWLLASEVHVGDTPTDGFATFTPNYHTTCKDCGGELRQAFDTTKRYRSCRRCGHVFG